MAEHIQIGNISPRTQYVGDGSRVTFDYLFPIFADDDIAVYVDGVLQTLVTRYTLSGAGDSNGGIVTFVLEHTPGLGEIVTLVRDLTVKRTTDFQESGEFRANVINDELDKIIAMVQEAGDAQVRTLHQSTTDSGGDMQLPGKDTRKGRLLAFDPTTGDPVPSTLTTAAIESGTTDASASAVAADASASEAASSATSAAASASSAAQYAAGDSQLLIDGVGFTAGSSTTAILTNIVFTSENHLAVFFDGVKQFRDTWTLMDNGTDTTVTFNAVIPAGVGKIECDWGIRSTTLSGASINIDGGTIDGTIIGAAGAAEGTFTDLSATGDVTLNNLTVAGTSTFTGGAFEVNTTTVTTDDNLIIINDGEVGAGVTGGTAGLQVDRGSLTDYQFMFRESDDAFVIGEVGSLQAVATREDTPTDNGLAYWDSAAFQFKTDGPTWDGSAFSVSGTLDVGSSTSSWKGAVHVQAQGDEATSVLTMSQAGSDVSGFAWGIDNAVNGDLYLFGVTTSAQTEIMHVSRVDQSATFAGAIIAADGSAGSPGIVFSSEGGANSGIFYRGANEMGFSSGTAEVLATRSTGIQVTSNMGVGGSVYTEGTLHVRTSTAGVWTADTATNDIVVESNTDTGISMAGGVNSGDRVQIMMGTANQPIGAIIRWVDTDAELKIMTNRVGEDIQLRADNQVLNLTLSGASGSELATFAGVVQGISGSAAIVPYSFSSDTDTGMYLNGRGIA